MGTDWHSMTWRVAAGEDAAAWRGALADGAWMGAAEVMKEEGESWVRRARIGGREVVVKRRKVRGVYETMKVLAGGSRFMRHWRGAEWLLANGFATGRPLAHGRRVWGMKGEEVLVLEFVPGRTVLEHLAAGDLGVKREHAVARELGRMVARLAAKGRYNRDGKPSNLVVMEDGRVVILDTVAIRRSGGSGDPEFGMMSLVIEAIGTGSTPRRGLMMRVMREVVDESARLGRRLDRREFVRMAWAEVGAMVEAHGDPRPRTDPLG